jgi:tRNA dimethylallyltransferase
MKLPLIVITGPTASGKTSLAIELAKKYGGEIICADSRTIYKGMDIGTAKPSIIEQATVPHWGLNLVSPGDYFSVVDFKCYAIQKIAEIRVRDHIPFLVGGTGLYIDSVLFDYKFGPPANEEFRSELQHMEIEELQQHCNENMILLPENKKNKRYLIRTIESKGFKPDNRKKPIDFSIVVGITTNKEVLRNRIVQRFEQMLNDGVVEEASQIGEKYGWNNEAMKSNIYPLIHLYFEKVLSLNEVKNKFIVSDWRLAKRQMTWLRRNKFIHWLSLNDSKKYLSDQLAIYENS